jgi:FtsH-binding integral membrane protein
MTLVWGFGLVAEASVAGVLVFLLSVREFMIVSPILGYSTMGALSAWSFWYGRRQRRKGAARRAAAEAAAASAAAPETGAV